MNKCDVIIPIYNAYDCLAPCIDSVIKNTNLEENRIILINDKSPDERVLPLLKKYENKKNIILLNNETNLGFVGTVNKGMKYSNNDVLLLNSDTEVPKNWLDKIKKCAYSGPNVATVTPLSNNATLVSVPNGLQKNDLPEGYDIQKMDELVENCSTCQYPELPTAHGFCMYIRRNVLDTIGYFDDKTFGKGYGEENDFSYRCLDYGFKNVLCDNTIVYHKESQSFSAAKAKLQQENSKALKNRYPIYVSRTEIWCMNFPISYICKKIKYALEIEKRTNILYVIHDWENIEKNTGGTTLHAYDLIKKLRNKYNFHVLYLSEGVYKIHSYFEKSEDEIKLYNIDNVGLIPRYNNKYREMIDNIIESFNISIVHIHHLMNGHMFDWTDVFNSHNVYSIISVHDYYCLCPNINMLYNLKDNCLFLKEKDCKSCLKKRWGIVNDIIGTWRSDWDKLLGSADVVITPSMSTKKDISKVYDNISNIKIIEHGVDMPKSSYVPKKEKVFNIAFVGAMAPHKGSNVLINLIKNSKTSKIKFHLFGGSVIKELTKNKSNYIYHGAYKREDLPKLLEDNKIDLVCLFSICSETYCYTLTESIASGVPVLTYDVGAVKDRVESSNCGWIISHTSTVDEVENKIKDIISNTKDYDEKIENIKNHKIRTVSDMSTDYNDIYKNIKKDNFDLNKFKEMFETELKNSETIDSLQLKWILNSRRWKLVSKIQIPDFIKKIVGK